MDFKLYFAGDRDYALSLAPTTSVVIWPHEDRFSDAGYRLQVGMLVRLHLEPYVIDSPAALIAGSFNDSAKAIEYVLKGQKISEVGWALFPDESRLEIEDEPQWFATLLGSVNEYRELARVIGSEHAVAALKVARDLSVLTNGGAVGDIRAALESDAFRRGVLRSHDRYFAYRRGRSALDGNEVEAERMQEARATVRFQLAGFKGRHEVTMDFRRTELFDRRINVLIGENGVGKSQTLAHIVSSLAKLKNGGSIASSGSFSRVIAFSAVPGKSSLPSRLSSQRILKYRHFALSPRSERGKGDNQITAALVDLARDTTRIGGRHRIHTFIEAVGKWLPLSRIGLRVKAGVRESPRTYVATDGNYYLPLQRLLEPIGDGAIRLLADIDLSRPPAFFAPRRTREGEFEADPEDVVGAADARFLRGLNDGSKSPENRGFQPLSSGQELFFRFALNLCTFIEVGTLVLLDEPENHLHPTFITRLMTLLRQVLQATGSFAVIATHSPFIVREVTRMDVSIMSRDDDGVPRVRHPRLQTLGASVAAVSGYVFQDETVPTLARLTVTAMERARNGVDLSSEEGVQLLNRELSNEAVGYIRASLLRASRGTDGKS